MCGSLGLAAKPAGLSTEDEDNKTDCSSDTEASDEDEVVDKDFELN
jgi:hypothetical protein